MVPQQALIETSVSGVVEGEKKVALILKRAESSFYFGYNSRSSSWFLTRGCWCVCFARLNPATCPIECYPEIKTKITRREPERIFDLMRIFESLTTYLKKIDWEQIKAKRYMWESGEGSDQRSLSWSIVLKPHLPIRTEYSLFPWWMNFIWLSAIYSAGCSTLCTGEWSIPSIQAECNWLCSDRLRFIRTAAVFARTPPFKRCIISVSDAVWQVSGRLERACKPRDFYLAVQCHPWTDSSNPTEQITLCCDSTTCHCHRTTCLESLRWCIHLGLYPDKTPRWASKPYRAGIAKKAGGILHPAGRPLCSLARLRDLAGTD